MLRARETSFAAFGVLLLSSTSSFAQSARMCVPAVANPEMYRNCQIARTAVGEVCRCGINPAALGLVVQGQRGEQNQTSFAPGLAGKGAAAVAGQPPASGRAMVGATSGSTVRQNVSASAPVLGAQVPGVVQNTLAGTSSLPPGAVAHIVRQVRQEIRETGDIEAILDRIRVELERLGLASPQVTKLISRIEERIDRHPTLGAARVEVPARNNPAPRGRALGHNELKPGWGFGSPHTHFGPPGQGYTASMGAHGLSSPPQSASAGNRGPQGGAPGNSGTGDKASSGHGNGGPQGGGPGNSGTGDKASSGHENGGPQGGGPGNSGTGDKSSSGHGNGGPQGGGPGNSSGNGGGNGNR
jgi:hypothetical protein